MCVGSPAGYVSARIYKSNFHILANCTFSNEMLILDIIVHVHEMNK